MVTVACVLRSGGHYTPDYVHRLRDGVDGYLSGHRWVCLSDMLEVATHSLEHHWPGWWSKIELFRPGLLTGPTIYFDLDTIIVGDLNDLGQAATGFRMLRDFTVPTRWGSGVMLWDGDWSAIYSAFAANPQHHMNRCRTRALHGDQGFISETVGDGISAVQDAVPDQVVSYKCHVRGKSVPARARVVCFHGQPRPKDIDWQL